MIEIFAYGTDQFHLSSWLYPGAFPDQTILAVVKRLSTTYFIPLIVLGCFCYGLRKVLKLENKLGISVVLLALSPGGLWLALVYADPSAKAYSNSLELLALGALAGVCIGINGRLVFPFRHAIVTASGLCAAALCMYFFVPAYPQMSYGG